LLPPCPRTGAGRTLSGPAFRVMRRILRNLVAILRQKHRREISALRHHQVIYPRVAVDAVEAAAWLRVVLGDEWAPHACRQGAMSGVGGRLSTVYFRLFLALTSSHATGKQSLTGRPWSRLTSMRPRQIKPPETAAPARWDGPAGWRARQGTRSDAMTPALSLHLVCGLGGAT
jgi:hypothetical protein